MTSEDQVYNMLPMTMTLSQRRREALMRRREALIRYAAAQFAWAAKYAKLAKEAEQLDAETAGLLWAEAWRCNALASDLLDLEAEWAKGGKV